MVKEAPLTEAVYYILLALRTPNHGYWNNTRCITNDRWKSEFGSRNFIRCDKFFIRKRMDKVI